jgi:hypothetical protein
VRDDRKRPPAGGFLFDIGGKREGQGGSVVHSDNAPEANT